MLGNDVVDLLDVDARPETFHRRFDTRVFAAEERQAIAADARPQALRWAHWGAKEAAYKLVRQLDPKFVFAPIRLVACFESASPRGAGAAQGSFERRGRLELASGPPGRVPAIELKSFETPDFVHVVALAAGADWGAVVMAVESLSIHSEALHSDAPHSEALHSSLQPKAADSAAGGSKSTAGEAASLAVRRLALREIGRALGVEAGRLAIGRLSADRQGRIPTVELDGRTAPFALSLSHHGRFVAFALAPKGRGVEREPGARAGGGERGDGDDRRGSVDRSDSGSSAGGVGQAVWAVGCPVGAADTAWMVG